MSGLKKWWRNLSVLRKGAFVVGIPIFALATSVAVLFADQAQNREAIAAVNRTMKVETAAHEVLRLLVDGESGVRAYVATGEPEFLDQYQNARRRFDPAVEELSFLVRDERASALLGTIERLARERLRMLETLRTLKAHGDFSAAEELTALRRGKATMEAVRRAMNTFLARQEALLELRQQRFEAELQQTNAILTGSLVLGILGGLLALGIFSIGIARRIKDVGANARLVGQGREPAATLPARDEIGRLDDELRQAAALIHQRTQELVLARKEADRANMAKSEFLSRMSHELRTPLNAILGFAQLLGLDELTPEQKDSVQEIVRGGAHLLELIDEVLDLARIEIGRLDLLREAVDVVDLAEETTSMLRPVAEARGIKLELRDPSLLEHRRIVTLDRQRLKQVLLNIIGNSIKYNRDEGRVIVSFAELQGDLLEIAVSDTGPGISPADIQRVFAPFERLGAERGDVEGTGLGLPLTKHLVEAMDGEIEVESEIGKGSTFLVRFPLARESRDEVPAATEGTEEPKADELLVLYIEDNRSDVKLLHGAFAQTEGLRLVAADRGRSGLHLSRSEAFDVILLDLQLPDIDGKEVFETLRAAPSTAEVPIIIITGAYRESERGAFQRAGALAFLTKPIDIQEVLDLLLAIRSERIGAEQTA